MQRIDVLAAGVNPPSHDHANILNGDNGDGPAGESRSLDSYPGPNSANRGRRCSATKLMEGRVTCAGYVFRSSSVLDCTADGSAVHAVPEAPRRSSLATRLPCLTLIPALTLMLTLDQAPTGSL